MNYGTCVRCKRMIGYANIRMCKDCKEDEFNRIKKFLEGRGICSTHIIHSELEIPKRLLAEFVLEGRLGANFIPQDEIDKIIEDNRRARLINTLSALQDNAKSLEQAKKESIFHGSKMRYLRKRDK